MVGFFVLDEDIFEHANGKCHVVTPMISLGWSSLLVIGMFILIPWTMVCTMGEINVLNSLVKGDATKTLKSKTDKEQTNHENKTLNHIHMENIAKEVAILHHQST